MAASVAPRFPAEARRLIDRIERAYYDRILTDAEFEANEQLMAEVSRLSVQSTSPLERLERALSPWVAFVIVPLFALANAGVGWAHMFGLAVCAGVGFTVALFVTSLSFTDPALADSAKVGILAGSLVAGALGFAILRTMAPLGGPAGHGPADDHRNGTSAAGGDPRPVDPQVSLGFGPAPVPR